MVFPKALSSVFSPKRAEFRLNVAYTLQVRYANAQRDEKSLSLYVNGKKLQQISFPVVATFDGNACGMAILILTALCFNNHFFLLILLRML